MQNTDGIIFDLDGTLWDSTATIAEAWQKAIDELGVTDKKLSASDIKGIAGMPYDAIYDKLFPAVKGHEREQLQYLCAKYELETLLEKGGSLYPNLIDVLIYLQEQGRRLAIVSNCQQGYIEAFLEYHQLQQFFKDHECYGNKKLPKHENIKAVISRNEFSKAVYVGDTAGDREASEKAGVPFILASYGFGDIDKADYIIKELTELKRLF